jgi:FkbM family methyltransferase
MIIDKVIRKLPDFKGKQRISRLIYRDYLKKAVDIVVTGAYGCKYLLPNLIETISFELFINGIYERDTHEFLLKRIPANAVFLDLGANIGSIVIPICRKRNDLRVISVEAAPWVFEYLKKNIELNGLTNIEILNRAILDTDDQEIDFFGPTEKFGKGSLTPHYTNKSIKVPTIQIDTLLKKSNISKVDFIKIDIQGFEYYAFKGAAQLLQSPDAPDILFEFEDWAEREASGLKAGFAQALLKEYGYEIYLLRKADQLVRQNDIIVTGTHMLYATKKKMD